MERFEYLDHTSEAKFKAYGKTLEEAFANAGLAMTNLMVDVDEVESEDGFEISIEADNHQSLLYDFLDEIIYIRDVNGLFISEFEDLEITGAPGEYYITGLAKGDKIKNYETKSDVKAPTYDEMKVEETDDGWMIQAVVDV